MFVVMKKIDFLLWGIIFSPLTILIGLVVYETYFKEKLPEKEQFLQNRSRIEFNAKIISIKNDRKNRSIETIFSKYDKFVLPDEWREKVMKGDSISKNEGELFLKVFRKDSLIDSLNYDDIIFPRRVIQQEPKLKSRGISSINHPILKERYL